MGKTPLGAGSTVYPAHGRMHLITLEKFFLISLLSHMNGGQVTRNAVLETEQWNTPGLHPAPPFWTGHSPGGLDSKELACNVGDLGSIPGL